MRPACDLGIAAVICFHRGETGAARDHLAAAVPHAKRIGHRLISSTGTRPQPGLRAGRRATGGAGRADRCVRRQYGRPRGDRGPAGRRRPPRRRDRRPEHRAGARGSRRRARRRIGDPAPAGERAVLPRPAGPRRSRLLTAAERYEDAGRPLPRAKALEAAAGYFVDADDRTRRGPPSPPPSRSTPRWARPRTSPGCRPRSGPTASGAGRTPSTGGRRAAGTASRRPRSRSPRSSRRACPTRRSPPGCCYPAGPSPRTSPTS